MVDFQAIMQVFSQPRPNGSRAERETRAFIKEWLSARHISVISQPFRHSPYFFEAIGLWLILTRLLLVWLVWQRFGWWAVILAVAGLAGGLLDYLFHLPLVTWVGRRQGENLLARFEPALPATQELILSAHYDTKTEPLDHHQRMVFLKSIPLGAALTLLAGLLSPLDRALWLAGSPAAAWTHAAALGLCLPVLILTLGFALNLSLGRLLPPSPGAVDNGAACAILLGLGERLLATRLQHTRLTLAWFGAEEVDRQGSAAYVRQRQSAQDWLPRTAAVNLEALAQDGGYVIWERDGRLVKLRPTHTGLNQALQTAIHRVTGEQACLGGPMLSDSGPFVLAGIPAAVFGTYHSTLKDRGFHSPQDNLARMSFERLPETVTILLELLHMFDENAQTILEEGKEAA